MDNRDILTQVCSHLDNSTLQSLSKTSIWSAIREFANEPYFWYLRVQHLVGSNLKERTGITEWKEAYYILEPVLALPNPFTLEVLVHPLSVSILEELGHECTTGHLNSTFKLAQPIMLIEVVRALLRDGRVDLTIVTQSYVIGIAAEEGLTESVRKLLQVRCLDPAVDHGYALRRACEEQHVEVVKLLLADGRTSPRYNYDYSIRYACNKGHAEIVKLLLADPRVNPNTHDGATIIGAAYRGHIEVVKLLLADPRIDPSCQNNVAMNRALTRGHIEVVRLLLTDKRVRDKLGASLESYTNMFLESC